MKRALSVQSILGLLLIWCTGCAAVGSGDASGADGAQKQGAAAADEGLSDEEVAEQTQKLEHELDVNRARVKLAHMEIKAFEASHANRMAFAEEELSFAEAALATFKDFDVPNRLEIEQLSLKASKDNAQEAAEELAQIEIMYKDQDLDDVTAEFVVSRGRRRAERAAARISIQERDLEKLQTRELPSEEAQLILAVKKAKEAVDAAKREGELEQHNKAISIKEAERAVVETEAELAKLSDENDQ